MRRTNATVSPAASLDAYQAVRDDFADGMGRILDIYGINPLYGRLYGALYLTPRPVSLGDVATMLGMAKSTTSVALRQLEAFGLVRRSRRLRDRRDYYEVETDGRAIMMGFLRNYVERELEEGLRMAQRLKEGMVDAGGAGWPIERDMEIVRNRANFIINKTTLGQNIFKRLHAVITLSHSGHDLLLGVQRLVARPWSRPRPREPGDEREGPDTTLEDDRSNPA